MTNTIMSLAIILVVIGFFIILKRETDTEVEVTELSTMKADDKRVTAIAEQLEGIDEQTKDALRRMEEIAASIGKMEEEHAQDHRDLVDIRERYVLYREPTNTGAGVAWASEQKCFDDMTIDEQIEDLGRRADEMLKLIANADGMADTMRYHNQYQAYLIEIQRLLEQQKEKDNG